MILHNSAGTALAPRDYNVPSAWHIAAGEEHGWSTPATLAGHDWCDNVTATMRAAAAGEPMAWSATVSFCPWCEQHHADYVTPDGEVPMLTHCDACVAEIRNDMMGL